MATIRPEIKGLIARSPIGWLRERDIDLLLCAELHIPGALRDHFAGLWPDDRLQFVGAWVSHTEVNGETDLVIEFRGSGAHFVIFAENKIAADFQPNQALRYAERANHWQRTARVRVKTVLICPQDYLSRPTCEDFDVPIAYEDLIEVLRNSNDQRSDFLARALAEGIEVYNRGYIAIPDRRATSIWDAIWRAASTDHPALNMKKPAQKPGKSTWIYFRRPRGFTEADTKRCAIVYKAARGQVDLQFSSTTVLELERVVGTLIKADMSVVQAGKSAGVRVNVPDVKFSSAAEPQIESIRIGLYQAERLRRFFVENTIGNQLLSSNLT